MIKKGSISPRQIFFILVLLLAGIYVLILPRQMVYLTGTDGWLVIFAGGIISGVVLIFINKLLLKFPGKTVVEFAPLLTGILMGKLISFILVTYFTLLAAGSLRLFTEMLRSVLLPDTPSWVIVVFLVGLIIWIVQNGLEDIARFTELIAPIILLLILSSLIGDIGYMNLIRLKPVLQSELFSLAMGTISATSYFGVIIVLLMLYPYVDSPEKLTKTSIFALVFALCVIIALYAGTIATFGIFETTRMAWPVIELVKLIRIGEFIERMEALFLSVWLSIAFINVSVLAFCSITGWTQLLNKKKYHNFTYPIMIILLVLSLWPRDLLVLLDFYNLNFTYGLIISLLIPLFLYFVSIFYRKKGDIDAS